MAQLKYLPAMQETAYRGPGSLTGSGRSPAEGNGRKKESERTGRKGAKRGKTTQ